MANWWRANQAYASRVVSWLLISIIWVYSPHGVCRLPAVHLPEVDTNHFCQLKCAVVQLTVTGWAVVGNAKDACLLWLTSSSYYPRYGTTVLEDQNHLSMADLEYGTR